MKLKLLVYLYRCDYCGVQSEPHSSENKPPPDGWVKLEKAIWPPVDWSGGIRTYIAYKADAYFCSVEHREAWKFMTGSADSIEIPRKLEIFCKRDGNALWIPEELLESLNIPVTDALMGRQLQIRGHTWQIVGRDERRDSFYAKAIKPGMCLRITIPEVWIRQFMQDAYDSGLERRLWNIHVENLGGSPHARLVVQASGAEADLQQWGRHLVERWGARRSAIEHEDKHRTDAQWFAVMLSIKLGSLYIMPAQLSVGRKLVSFALLGVGWEYGTTKPKVLLGAMRWHGNNKLMWSVSLAYLTLEYMQIGRGAGDYYLY